MAWLLRQGEVLASLELADSTRAKVKGFFARQHDRGALLLRRTRTAHSVGSRCPIDVAYLDDNYVVVSMRRLSSNRLSLPRRGCSAVLEAEAGAFERWRLQPGDRLEISD